MRLPAKLDQIVYGVVVGGLNTGNEELLLSLLQRLVVVGAVAGDLPLNVAVFDCDDVA